jgi:hypothetical protein
MTPNNRKKINEMSFFDFFSQITFLNKLKKIVAAGFFSPDDFFQF